MRYVHTILKAALREAVEQGMLATNPADNARPPAARAAKAPEIHPWSGQQLSAFLEWAQNDDAAHAAAYRVLAYTGMRRGEVLALRWRDLDLTHARLSVRRAVGVVKVKGEGQTITEGLTKSAKPRVINLSARTLEVLKAWRLERAGLSLQLAREDALIFGDLEGRLLHPERFSQRFVDKQGQCRRALGTERPPVIRLHDLRHTHATIMLQAGVPVKVVSERLGHATVMITLEIHAQVMPGMQAEAADAFDAAIAGGV